MSGTQKQKSQQLRITVHPARPQKKPVKTEITNIFQMSDPKSNHDLLITEFFP
jgi:hypothetical protein